MEESPDPNPLPVISREETKTLSPAQIHLLLAALLLAGFVGHILYLTIGHPMGLAGDEAHYWDWSRQLDWSYYSKGPAIAVVIRAGRLLFGDTLLGVRFFALVFAVGTSLCTYWLTCRVFNSERLALAAVAITYTVPLFIAGSLLMTIDAPYYFCWATATCFGYLAAVENKKWAWPAAGVFVGLGFLAKYAALLWLVGLLVFLLLRNRPALKTIWPWLTIVIAFVFTTPVLIWNSHHDWVSFGHVARSTSEDQNHFNPLKVAAQFGELLGGQIGLLNPIIFAFMVGGCLLPLPLREGVGGGVQPYSVEHLDREETSRNTANPLPLPPPSRGGGKDAKAYLLAIGLPFFVFVSLVTLRKNTEPNWPAPTYFTLIPLATWFAAKHWPKTRGWLIGAICIGIAAIVVIHESTLFVRFRPIARAASRLIGYDDIGHAVSAELKTLGPGALVLCDKYQMAGLMAFYVDGHPKTFCVGSYIQDPQERDRLTQYDLWPDRDLAQPSLRGHNAVFVGHAPPDVLAAFDRVEPLPDLPIDRHGVTIRRQSMWRCYGFHGMTRPNDGLTKR